MGLHLDSKLCLSSQLIHSEWSSEVVRKLHHLTNQVQSFSEDITTPTFFLHRQVFLNLNFRFKS